MNESFVIQGSSDKYRKEIRQREALVLRNKTTEMYRKEVQQREALILRNKTTEMYRKEVRQREALVLHSKTTELIFEENLLGDAVERKIHQKCVKWSQGTGF